MNGLNLLKYPALILLSVVLAGCVAVPENHAVMLANTLKYTLTPPPIAYIETTDSQLIEITYQKQTHIFIAQVEYRANEIAMAAISPEGMAIFDFVWRAGLPLQIKQYVPLPEININNIIADIQLCHWPIAQVISSIEGPETKVVQDNNLGNSALNWQRTISQENEPVIKIQKSGNEIIFDHLIRHYRIKLTDLNQEGI